MTEKQLRLKGLSISKEDFEEKYDIQMTAIEWQSLITMTSKTWEEQIDELKLLAFRHIRKALGEIGFKPTLNNNELKFVKSTSE